MLTYSSIYANRFGDFSKASTPAHFSQARKRIKPPPAVLMKEIPS
jgi:hypothetical protein